MHDLRIGWDDVQGWLRPDSVVGAIVYLVMFVLLALALARGLRLAVHTALSRQGHIDRTTVSFLQQAATAAIWIIMIILYAHLIPVLRAVGTAMLTGAGIASVVIGLAAQSTLGNLVAGIAITIYRPFRLGDTLQVAAPTGTETGTIELISLGYTTLRTSDGRLIVLPNSVAASQVTINLSTGVPVTPLPLQIHIGHGADVERARDLAVRTARETVGESAAVSCVLKRIDADGATLELHVPLPPAADRDALRSKLIAELARRFAASGLDPADGGRASFS